MAALTKFEPDESHAVLAWWRLGEIKMTRLDARAVLNDPHYVENDSTRTAGGPEDHWAYLSPDHIPVFFRLRVPYNFMDLCSTAREFPTTSWLWIHELFPDCEIRQYDEPWDENKGLQSS